MKLKRIVFTMITASFIVGNSIAAHAGVPLNNLEGVGGVAFNPLAYTAGTDFDAAEKTPGISTTIKDVVRKPQFGLWYVRLNRTKIDWNAESVATTLFDRLEVSYGNEIVALDGGQNIHKGSTGLKALLVKENDWDTKWVPAVSVGTIYKQTSFQTGNDVDKNGYDYYAVATKLITQLPKPVLLSGGILSTNSRTTGVLGFDKKRDTTWFANIDVLPLKDLAVGFEYKQGADFGTAYKNSNDWDAHLAWFANKNLTLVAAYVNAGNQKGTKNGLGDGFVLSAQYAF